MATRETRSHKTEDRKERKKKKKKEASSKETTEIDLSLSSSSSLRKSKTQSAISKKTKSSSKLARNKEKSRSTKDKDRSSKHKDRSSKDKDRSSKDKDRSRKTKTRSGKEKARSKKSKHTQEVDRLSTNSLKSRNLRSALSLPGSATMAEASSLYHNQAHNQSVQTISSVYSQSSDSSSCFTSGEILSDDDEDSRLPYMDSWSNHSHVRTFGRSRSSNNNGNISNLRTSHSMNSMQPQPILASVPIQDQEQDQEQTATNQDQEPDRVLSPTRYLRKALDMTKSTSKHMTKKLRNLTLSHDHRNSLPASRERRSSSQSTTRSIRKSIQRYVKKGGVRKLHTGILFSVDYRDGPLGVKVEDSPSTVFAHVGFRVERSALAGASRKGGVKEGDFMVAIGDDLITDDMGWEQALDAVFEKPRPMRITYFRPYTADELDELNREVCLCENGGEVDDNELCRTCGNPIDIDAGGGEPTTMGGMFSSMIQAAMEKAAGLGSSQPWHVLQAIHTHKLYFAPQLPTNMHWCDLCNSRILGEAFRCKTCDWDVCVPCLMQHMPEREHLVDYITHHDRFSATRYKSKRKRIKEKEDLIPKKPIQGNPKLIPLLHRHQLDLLPITTRTEAPQLRPSDLSEASFRESFDEIQDLQAQSREEGHAPTPFHWCDVCNGKIENESYRCTLCDWDCCERCMGVSLTPPKSFHFVKAVHKHELECIMDLDELAPQRWCDECSEKCRVCAFRCNECDYDICLSCFYGKCGEPLAIDTFVEIVQDRLEAAEEEQ